MIDDKKLSIVILTDDYKRAEHILDILVDGECENGTVKRCPNGILYAKGVVYKHVTPSRYMGISADQVILDRVGDYSMVLGSLLMASCVPDRYKVIDDRDLLMGVYMENKED